MVGKQTVESSTLQKNMKLKPNQKWMDEFDRKYKEMYSDEDESGSSGSL